jgi:hypothetical protein
MGAALHGGRAFSLRGGRYHAGMMRFAPIFVLALLAACGGDNADKAPAPATSDEAKALGDAAEMIDARRAPPEAMTPPATQPPGPAAPK